MNVGWSRNSSSSNSNDNSSSNNNNYFYSNNCCCSNNYHDNNNLSSYNNSNFQDDEKKRFDEEFFNYVLQIFLIAGQKTFLPDQENDDEKQDWSWLRSFVCTPRKKLTLSIKCKKFNRTLFSLILVLLLLENFLNDQWMKKNCVAFVAWLCGLVTSKTLCGSSISL